MELLAHVLEAVERPSSLHLACECVASGRPTERQVRGAHTSAKPIEECEVVPLILLMQKVCMHLPCAWRRTCMHLPCGRTPPVAQLVLELQQLARSLH